MYLSKKSLIVLPTFNAVFLKLKTWSGQSLKEAFIKYTENEQFMKAFSLNI